VTFARGSVEGGDSQPDVDGRSSIRGIGPTLPPPVSAAVTRVRSAAWLARSLGRADERGLRILFYHRIADDRDELAVPPRRFREQMNYLASAGYRVLDVVQVTDLLDREVVPERTVGLSFDDGYLDVAENALPVLSELGFRATVFIATGVTEGTASFEWYGRQPPLLTWDEVVQLDGGGTLEFEAHSVTHPNLLTVDDRRAADEIINCRYELERRLGRPATAFSYPAGLFEERERRLVMQAGYRVAVSCKPGINLPSTDRFALRRRQVDAGDRLLDFRAKVGGGHDTPLPFRGVYRRVRYGEGVGRSRLASSRR
jgi:peptidoglycan/xylan/chitin deacetylase (PgdA/CDA1 family)